MNSAREVQRYVAHGRTTDPDQMAHLILDDYNQHAIVPILVEDNAVWTWNTPANNKSE